MSYLLSKDRDYKINPDQPYNLTQAGVKLGVSPETVRRLIDDGEINGFQVRTCWRIKGKSLINYMKRKGYKDVD